MTIKKTKTAAEVIAEVERDADNDGIYCVGDPLASRILIALYHAGWRVVRDLGQGSRDG